MVTEKIIVPPLKNDWRQRSVLSREGAWRRCESFARQLDCESTVAIMDDLCGVWVNGVALKQFRIEIEE